METLGHSRISITMDTYTHVMPALQREAADAIDRSLGGER
jgi:integrase